MSAFSSGSNANYKFTGNDNNHVIIVVAQIEKNTPGIWADEDALPRAESVITSVMNLTPNGLWYTRWAKEGFTQLDEIADSYVKTVLRDYDAEDLDPRFIDNLFPLAKEIIFAFGNMMAAKAVVENNSHQDEDRVKYKEYEWNQKYRAAVNLFSQKSHRLTGMNTDSSFRQNIRVQEPITFGGVNKIVAIFRISNKAESRGYAHEITIEYESPNASEAIEMITEDFRKSRGEHFIVKNRNGQVFYDNKEEVQDEVNNDVLGVEPDQFGYVPTELRPSEIGIPMI